MAEILKWIEDFTEDMADCSYAIPCLGQVMKGVSTAIYQHARESIGLRPER